MRSSGAILWRSLRVPRRRSLVRTVRTCTRDLLGVLGRACLALPTLVEVLAAHAVQLAIALHA